MKLAMISGSIELRKLRHKSQSLATVSKVLFAVSSAGLTISQSLVFAKASELLVPDFVN